MIRSKIEKQVWRKTFCQTKEHEIWRKCLLKMYNGPLTFELRGLDDKGQAEMHVWDQIGRDMNRGICAHIRADIERLI